jgi:hypothetical protein
MDIITIDVCDAQELDGCIHANMKLDIRVVHDGQEELLRGEHRGHRKRDASPRS